jgi:hypothetical protein
VAVGRTKEGGPAPSLVNSGRFSDSFLRLLEPVATCRNRRNLNLNLNFPGTHKY